MYAPNNRAPKYQKQNLRELRENENLTGIVGDFNTPLSIMDRPLHKN